MNKFLKLFLILSSLLIIFVSCSNGTNSPTTTQADNPTTDNPTTDTLHKFSTLAYMKYMLTDLSNVKGLSISKNITTNQSRSALSEASKYFLFKTETGSNYDLEKVTFKKQIEITDEIYDEDGNIIDENKIITQDEIEAQINKVYITDDFIFLQFIPIKTDSEELSSILKTVYTPDNGYSDIVINNVKKGFIVSGKLNGTDFSKKEFISIRDQYKVNIDGPINDIKYTFEQMCYYNNSICKSYVINRKNGCLYELPDFSEYVVYDDDENLTTYCEPVLFQDTLKVGQYTFKIEITDENKLQFTRIAVSGFPYKDRYGNRFSLNSELSGLDTKNNVYHIQHDSFIYNIINDNRLLIWGQYSDINWPAIDYDIKVFGKNFTKESLSVDDNLEFYGCFGPCIIKNGEIYLSDIKFDLNSNIIYQCKLPVGVRPDDDTHTYLQQFYISDGEGSYSDDYVTTINKIPFIKIIVKNDFSTAEEQNLKYVFKYYYISLVNLLSDDFEKYLIPLKYENEQYIKTVGKNQTSTTINFWEQFDFSGITKYKLNLMEDTDGTLIPCVTLESQNTYQNIPETIIVYPL